MYSLKVTRYIHIKIKIITQIMRHQKDQKFRKCPWSVQNALNLFEKGRNIFVCSFVINYKDGNEFSCHIF